MMVWLGELLGRSLQAGSAGIRSKLAIYRELRDNLSEGLRFYMSLQEAITTLRQQAGDYVLTRTIQKCASLPSIPVAVPAKRGAC